MPEGVLPQHPTAVLNVIRVHHRAAHLDLDGVEAALDILSEAEMNLLAFELGTVVGALKKRGILRDG
jgi:hypothetical protein